MNVVLFIISYIMLDIIGSILYVGLFFLLIMTLKKFFHMNEDKWSALFSYKKGKGMYYMLLFPYVFMLVIMFLLSKLWFETINFAYSTLGALSVILLLTLILIFALPKIKDRLNKEYQEDH